MWAYASSCPALRGQSIRFAQHKGKDIKKHAPRRCVICRVYAITSSRLQQIAAYYIQLQRIMHQIHSIAADYILLHRITANYIPDVIRLYSP